MKNYRIHYIYKGVHHEITCQAFRLRKRKLSFTYVLGSDALDNKGWFLLNSNFELVSITPV